MLNVSLKWEVESRDAKSQRYKVDIDEHFPINTSEQDLASGLDHQSVPATCPCNKNSNLVSPNMVPYRRKRLFDFEEWQLFELQYLIFCESYYQPYVMLSTFHF